MTTSLLGMAVARGIPDAVLIGLATGKYTLHGGVIRWAAGTPAAGQIVCHLLPIAAASAPAFSGAGIIAATSAAAAAPVFGAVAAIGGVASAVLGGINLFNTRKILRAVKQTMALAELNLAVTRNGFDALERRLDQLEQTLGAVRDSVAEILQHLQIEQRAELRVALDNLSHIEQLTDPQVRRETLVASAGTLAKIALMFEERLSRTTTLSEAMICEEYYCIASLAQIRCFAELRELTRARHLVVTTRDRWRQLSREIMRTHVTRMHPAKYLSSDFAADVPIAEIAEWMDFAYDESKGYAWIDELRADLDPWYYYKSLDATPPSRRQLKPADRDDVLQLHRHYIIPAARKLVARARVLESYVAQYELMEQHRLTMQEFTSALAELDPSDYVEEFLILEPLGVESAAHH